ncbi:MAG: hypothetical protein [Microviridae sp.]|nr:MAG: hypothetical protein [Microviridae sp.]
MEHEKSNGSFDQVTNMDSSKNEKLYESTPIQDTPFQVVKMQEKYFLALGKYRLTDLMDTFEAVEQEVINSTWDLLFRVISVAVTESIIQERIIAETVTQKVDLFKTNPTEGEAQ